MACSTFRLSILRNKSQRLRLMTLARFGLGTQCNGLIHPRPIDNFATGAGHHVKEVVDHFCVRTLLANFEADRGVHIHGDSFNALAALLFQQLGRIASLLLPSPTHNTRIRSASMTTVGYR